MTHELPTPPARPVSIWRTPLRVSDLLRGRVTRVPDYREQVAAATLPAPAKELVARVTRRTRLWGTEKLAVADELIAHFADGLAAGASAEEVVHDFGDEGIAAKLIRRAKRRNRSTTWHALKYATRGILLLLALYAVVFARFWIGRPTIRVDYFAQLNAPVEKLKPDEKAWPIYRRAIIALDLKHLDPDKAPRVQRERLIALQNAQPGDDRWPELAAWLDAHAADFAALQDAIGRPAMGTLHATDLPADPEIGREELSSRGYAYNFPLGIALANSTTADEWQMRDLDGVLVKDARRAAELRDGERFERDVTVLRTIARHRHGKLSQETFDSLGVDRIMINQCLAPVLEHDCSWLDDARLIRIAHLLPPIGGETISTIFNYDAERMAFYDLVQRIFTDNGHGDGRITPEGVRGLAGYGALYGFGLEPTRLRERPDVQLLFGLASIENTRARIVSEFDQAVSVFEQNSHKPAREMDWKAMWAVGHRLDRIQQSPVENLRTLPLSLSTQFLYAVPIEGERLLGRRDGVLVGIGLELYRRRHGQYPATLDALVSDFLPRLPVDRINGEPLKYRIVAGKPVIYSVGVDGDDDAARSVVDRDGNPEPDYAASWPMGRARKTDDGDWVVFGEPTNASQAASTAPVSGVQP